MTKVGVFLAKIVAIVNQKGGVVSATEGGRYLIVNVDKTGKTVTFFLNH